MSEFSVEIGTQPQREQRVADPGTDLYHVPGTYLTELLHGKKADRVPSPLIVRAREVVRSLERGDQKCWWIILAITPPGQRCRASHLDSRVRRVEPTDPRMILLPPQALDWATKGARGTVTHEICHTGQGACRTQADTASSRKTVTHRLVNADPHPSYRLISLRQDQGSSLEGPPVASTVRRPALPNYFKLRDLDFILLSVDCGRAAGPPFGSGRYI